MQLLGCGTAHSYERATTERLTLGQSLGFWGSKHIAGQITGSPGFVGDQAEIFALVHREFEEEGLHVGDNIGLIQLNEAQALIQPLETDGYYEKIGLRASGNAASTKTDGFIALIESRIFIRECIRRSMQSAFPLQIQTFSEAVELQQKCHNLPNLILLSAIEESKEASANDFKILSQIAPRIPIIVLACNNDAQMAKAAIRHGAKGYIPVTLGFDIAIEAVRFVLAGGTYVPIDYLLTRTWPGEPAV